MSLSEKVQQLNREIGSAMEHAMEQVRQEVSQWLSTSNEEILGRLSTLKPEVPETFLAQDDLGPAVGAAVAEMTERVRAEEREKARLEARLEAREDARREAAAAPPAPAGADIAGIADLRAALSAIDRARSQAEILNALLQESNRFATRAAILLLRGSEVRVWNGAGFGDADAALRQVSLGIPAEGAWRQVFTGQGPAYLSASDCALLCSRIEAPLAHQGALVPMILRDQVAAAVYADRTDDQPIAAEALQILAYTAALAIESLSFRERASTATLAEFAGEPAPAAVQPEPIAEPEPTAPEPEITAEPEPAEPTVPEIEAEAIAEPESESETSVWSAPAAESEAGPETLRTGPMPVTVGGWDSYEPAPIPEEVEAVPEPAPATAVPAPWASSEETSPYGVEPEAVADTAANDGEGTGTPTQQVDLRILHVAAGITDPPTTASAAAPSIAADSPDATVLLQRPNLREVMNTPTAASVVERPSTPPPPPIRAVPPPPPAASPTAAAADDTASAAVSATPEVRPPSDLQGPGWAFASTRVPVAPNDEALHEEARRLARLLVSEIKLYNEEQVEEGRRKRDIYERLREDIDRSRQMYEERVEQRILKTTDYFYQELVRILASGDARALGI